ncbi:MAG: trehalose synthase, partial [Thermoleophilia bacterium]|nr:trehalose synthase [Thermoleophilia bacterium]
NLGIRRRLAPLLGNNRRLIELMNSLLFSLPGTPVIYYGDEIGMGDNIYLGDRDGVRTPMQWSADRNAGFSDANPQKLYLPVVTDPEYHHSSINVEAQWANPESLLWWTKRTIALRKRHPALGHGELRWVPSENRKVLTYMRCTEDERILCVANLSRYTQYVELDLSEHEGWRPISLLGQVEFPVIGELPYMLTLGPHDHFWFVLEPAAADDAHPSRSVEVPTLQVAGDWSDLLLDHRQRRKVEALLPAYMLERRWFRSKARKVRAASIVDVVAVGGSKSTPAGYMTFVSVEFAEGDPETYVLPLVAEPIDPRPDHPSPLPPSTLARVSMDGAERQVAVYDGLADEAFNKALLSTMLRRRELAGEEGSLVSATTDRLRHLRAAGTGEEPTPLHVEQSNSTVVYGDRFLLKMFRMVDEGTNPDVELGRFLTEEARFEHAPAVGATLEYRPADQAGTSTSRTRTVAVLQEYVENEGDAWSYTLDALRRYLDDALAQPELPPLPPASLLQRSRLEATPLAHETIGHFLESARLLGQRTAELHAALASADEESVLAAEPITPMYRRSLYQAMRGATKRTFVALRRLQREQPSLQEILPLEDAIVERFRRLLDIGLTDVRIRVHGDYHLGQVLWTGRDFRIIDFEGEPARPIGERRIKRSPLKDVAGMVRSFDYAAWTICNERGTAEAGGGQHDERASRWIEYWYRWVSAIFLRAYLDTAWEHGDFVTRDEHDLAIILDSLLMEKALYELGYEANNRPDWVWIPARGLQSLLENDS